MISAATSMALRAPISGNIIPLDQVPDPVFAEKVLGDGIAIDPIDGKIYAPVDSQITCFTKDLHSFGFTTDTGVELLIHVGLDTASLQPEAIAIHIKEGDYVKAGQLIAEVNLGMLKQKGISAITLLLVCGDPYGWKLFTNIGEVLGGMTYGLILKEEPPVVEQLPDVAKNKQKHGFLQKLKFIIHTSKVIS